MVGLRTEHDVHVRRAGEDLGAFGLGDAAGDGQDGFLPGGRALVLDEAEAAQFGEHLLRRTVAYVAGVEDDHVRVGGA